MAGGFRNCRDKLYWSLNRRELYERRGTCMATARSRLKDAGRILFTARLVIITAVVMIRILRGMTNVIENVMDLMGR